MSWLKRGLGVAVCALLVACSPQIPTTPTNASGTFFKGGLIPATNIALTPTYTVPLEKLVYWAGVAAIAYYVVDPLAPNWEIQEAKFPDEHYKLAMKMKRYAVGGSGEARVVFNRRAQELANTSGYSGYRILEYSEGLESSILGSQRTTEGVIVLTGLKSPPVVAPQSQAPAAVAPTGPVAVPTPVQAPAALPPTALTQAEPPTLPQAQTSPLPQSKPKPKAKPKKRKDC